MATADASDGRTRRSLHPFGFAVGLYLALLALPLVFEALGRADALAQYVTFLGTLAVVTGSVWLLVARIDGAARRLGAGPTCWLPAVLPGTYVFVGYALLDSHGGVGFGYFIAGLAAAVVGIAVGIVARNRHFERVVAESETGIELQADWPAVTRRRVRIVWVVCALLVAGNFVAGYWLGLDWMDMWIVLMLLLQLGNVDSLSQAWPVSVSEAGLVRESALVTQVTGWEGVERYTRTDDALVLHRSWWPDIRLALDDLDDPDAVEDTVARFLLTA